MIAATREQGLEGVVAKRLRAPYAEGRRGSSWIKLKNRRNETFVVTGWRERRDQLPEFLLARRRNSSLVPAGSASLGLDPARRANLLAALAECEILRHRRRSDGRSDVRWVAPLVEVSADAHGRVDGQVRDAVLRDLRLPAQK